MARFPDPDVAVTAATLLARARRGTEGLSQGELAESLGLTPSALSRYEAGQREPSLTELQRIIGHTDYRLELRLAHEPRMQSSVVAKVLPDPRPYRVQDLHLIRRMPQVLAPQYQHLNDSDAEGPTVDEALLAMYEIKHLAKAALAPEARLQTTYAQYGSERDRDLIHLVLSVGQGAAQATAVLKRVIDDRADSHPGRRTRLAGRRIPARVPRLTWAHVVCCLRAEAAICAHRAHMLQRALETARDRRRARIRLEDAEFIARSTSGPTAEEEVDRARAALEAATEECAAWSRNGGTREVGEAGERYLAVELTELAARAQTLCEQLASQPSFAAWRTEYAMVDPLYGAWFDGDLSQAFAPPELLVREGGRDSIYAAVANAWPSHEEDADVYHGQAIDDSYNRPWQAALISPDTSLLPKRAVAVRLENATSHPTFYVLAVDAATKHPRDLIVSLPRPGSLTTLASRFAVAYERVRDSFCDFIHLLPAPETRGG